jgi:hypothetical protein
MPHFRGSEKEKGGVLFLANILAKRGRKEG